MDEYDTRKKKKKRRYFIVHTATINTRQGKRYLIKFYFLYNFYILNIIFIQRPKQPHPNQKNLQRHYSVQSQTFKRRSHTTQSMPFWNASSFAWTTVVSFRNGDSNELQFHASELGVSPRLQGEDSVPQAHALEGHLLLLLTRASTQMGQVEAPQFR